MMRKKIFNLTILIFSFLMIFSVGINAADISDYVQVTLVDSDELLPITDTGNTYEFKNPDLSGVNAKILTVSVPKGTAQLQVPTSFSSTMESKGNTLMYVSGVGTNNEEFGNTIGLYKYVNGIETAVPFVAKYSLDDCYLFIDSTMETIFLIYCVEEKVPTVDSISMLPTANYVGNTMECPIGVKFTDATDDTAVKLYVTAVENGTSADAVEGTVIDTTVGAFESLWTASEATVSLSVPEAGTYWVAAEIGESRAYQEVTVYADAKAYAEAALTDLVNWYKTEGFQKGDSYVGLSDSTGAGTGIDWEAYIFGALGYKADDEALVDADGKTYLDMKDAYFAGLSEEELLKTVGMAPPPKELSRNILGITALGGDPRNIGDKNLVKALISLAYEDNDIEGGKLKLDENGALYIRGSEVDILCESYLLLGLEVTNATAEEGYTEELRAAGLKAIQNYWGEADMSESKNMSDYYIMSMYPLVFMKDVNGMDGVADQLLADFRTNYASVIANGSKMNIFSVGVATSALVSSGLDFETYTTDKAWKDASGRSELSVLLGGQLEDGSIGVIETGRMATYEVFQGLVDMLNGESCFVKAHETYMETYPQYSDDYLNGKAVEKQIAAIGDVTLESKDAIAAARAAYDALSSEAKAYVENYDVLTAAEAKYAELTKPVDPPAPVKLPFTDVAEGAWYEDHVRYVFANGIMKGMTDTTFGPDVTLNRAMFITMIYRMEGEPAVSGAHGFSDVPAGSYYEKAVIWGTQNGIVEGYNGKYSPEDKITREQMAAIMYRYADYKGVDVSATIGFDKFSDGADVSNWAKEEMGWAVASGMITGHENGTLEPQGNATRAQAAAVLQRFDENILN